jgi:hypothetical protein
MGFTDGSIEELNYLTREVALKWTEKAAQAHRSEMLGLTFKAKRVDEHLSPLQAVSMDWSMNVPARLLLCVHSQFFAVDYRQGREQLGGESEISLVPVIKLSEHER